MNDQNPKPKSRSRHRGSRYQRAQDRRIAQKKADQRFYNSIFGIIGACVLVVLGLAMIASSGNAPQVGGGETLSQNVFLGLTVLEIGGLVIVAIIAFFMWRRITKR
ncbi:MAG: hypothetical protein ACSHX3_05500 [Litorimonas sp.]